MLKKRNTFSYYSFHDVLTRNAVYNFIIGGRGLGKTYGAKKNVIKAYLRNREQFIYLRRYKTELKTRSTFFADIAHEFPEFTFRVEGSEAQVCFDPQAEKPKWHTMGYFIALSVGQSLKGTSFHDVTTIIFDEFIIEKGMVQYLPEEEEVFNNFYSTVDRYQEKTRVLFLANAVSIMNPYFLAYDIKPDKEFVSKFDGFIHVHFANSDQFASEVVKTRFGKFIKNTGYDEYAIGNVFADAHEYLVAKKNSDARYFCTLETKSGTFSVWVDTKASPIVYYVQESRPKDEFVYTLEPSLMQEGKVLAHYSDKFMQQLRTGFGQGRVFFDLPRTRNAFYNIYKR